MPRIYAIGEGYQVTLPGYGRCTETQACVVPEHVADELRHRDDLRIEEGDTAPPDPLYDDGLKALIVADEVQE